MNETVNFFLLAGDKFMPEMHLKQPGFTVFVFHSQKTKKEWKSLCRQVLNVCVNLELMFVINHSRDSSAILRG